MCFLWSFPMCFRCYGNLKFLRLIMGKVEIGIYFCVTADVLKKVLQKCFWSSPLPTTWILSKALILIGCHGNRKALFSKKYSKIFFSEAIKGMMLKLCINVHDISLYINYIFIVVANVLSLLWQLKVSIYFIMEKWKLAFISVLLQIFWQSFTEMILEYFSTNHMNFVQITDFDWWPWQPKG